MWTPVLDCPVNNLLVKFLPLFSQSRLNVFDVASACATHPPLQYAIAGGHTESKYGPT